VRNHSLDHLHNLALNPLPSPRDNLHSNPRHSLLTLQPLNLHDSLPLSHRHNHRDSRLHNHL
jgi:hypothetical protein